jgi:thiamine-phosphate pyrophosphorylase
VAGRLSRGIYAITDCVKLSFQEVLEKSRIILDCGAVALQYRDKESSAATRYERARALQEQCRSCGTCFIINDDLELAVSLAADGVHLGADDTGCRSAKARMQAGSVIGVSCYGSLETARTAVADGASYVAFGAFFPTGTKAPRANPAPELLARAKAELRVPIVAIGGITPENAGTLVASGADLLAVVSALYSAPDPAAVMRKFSRLFADNQYG